MLKRARRRLCPRPSISHKGLLDWTDSPKLCLSDRRMDLFVVYSSACCPLVGPGQRVKYTLGTLCSGPPLPRHRVERSRRPAYARSPNSSMLYGPTCSEAGRTIKRGEWKRVVVTQATRRTAFHSRYTRGLHQPGGLAPATPTSPCPCFHVPISELTNTRRGFTRNL